MIATTIMISTRVNPFRLSDDEFFIFLRISAVCSIEYASYIDARYDHYGVSECTRLVDGVIPIFRSAVVFLPLLSSHIDRLLLLDEPCSNLTSPRGRE